MRRCLRPVCLLAALLWATIPVAADSLLGGDIQGLELCPQSFCGAAIFVGEFDGHVNGFPRHGAFLAGITHDPELPDENGETIGITGGAWIIQVPFRTIRGVVTEGILTSNGDDTFTVDMGLLVTSPRSWGAKTFHGTLRHDVFPPTIEGTID
jgi:hypothetical protein